MPEFIIYDPLTKLIEEKFYSVDPAVVKGKTNCLEIPRDIFNSLTEYHIVDNGQVRLMTQTEKDVYEQAKLQAQIDAENKRIADLDDLLKTDLSGMTLTKIDNAINAINNLNDAKNFLKKLCRYIIKFISRQ